MAVLFAGELREAVAFISSHRTAEDFMPILESPRENRYQSPRWRPRKPMLDLPNESGSRSPRTLANGITKP